MVEHLNLAPILGRREECVASPSSNWADIDALAEEVVRLRAQLAEMTERAELAEQTAKARDELLGQWIAKVEWTAEVEANLARVGEAMRDERRRRLLLVADLIRVRRAVENLGDRAAIVAMKAALNSAASPDVKGGVDA